MKFEINVKNREKLEKLAITKKLKDVLGMGLASAAGIARSIFELLESRVGSASLIIDSEETEMKPLFSIQKNMPLFQDEELGITITLIDETKELNLCELLKDCIGMEFYMPHYGKVICSGQIKYDKKQDAICFRTNENGMAYDWPVRANGVSLHGNSNEICVFPSKEQRDWNLFIPPWVPKEGERVWVRDSEGVMWNAAYFVRKSKNGFIVSQKSYEFEKTECVPFEPIPW